jgi:MazG family protein
MNSKKHSVEGVAELLDILRRLRAPGGCPWDREQTHKSLKAFFMEECAELMDAVEDGDTAAMREELGDLLLHVALCSVIAEEEGSFDLDEVARLCAEKLRRRHPHVFGESKADTAGQVIDLWDKIKKKEKPQNAESSIMDGVPRHFPALLQAEKVQKRAAKHGFDWSEEKQIVEKIEEELAELKKAMASGDSKHTDEELGDLLFAVTNLARFRKGATSEDLLAAAVKKFQTRFRHIERGLKKAGKSLESASLEDMEALWNEAKRNKEQGI